MNRTPILLGVNIDHIATLRQARREVEPDPVAAARVARSAGADMIVAHLPSDYRPARLARFCRGGTARRVDARWRLRVPVSFQ